MIPAVTSLRGVYIGVLKVGGEEKGLENGGDQMTIAINFSKVAMATPKTIRIRRIVKMAALTCAVDPAGPGLWIWQGRRRHVGGLIL